jgi:glycosyltransferase involved in cell wall biosynthesis
MTTANADSNKRFLIFLPVRNGGRYIHSTIASILSQTVGDWLLYVLENCSSDDTLTIVESFNDPRIRVIPARTDLSIEQNWGRIADVLQATATAGQLVTMTVPRIPRRHRRSGGPASGCHLVPDGLRSDRQPGPADPTMQTRA